MALYICSMTARNYSSWVPPGPSYVLPFIVARSSGVFPCLSLALIKPSDEAIVAFNTDASPTNAALCSEKSSFDAIILQQIFESTVHLTWCNDV